VFPDLRARTDQAHISQKHVNQLWQFIELPTAKEWPDEREVLIFFCRNWMVLNP
jgi:hypothetical protein